MNSSEYIRGREIAELLHGAHSGGEGFPAVSNAFLAVKDVLLPPVRIGQFSPLPEAVS